MDLKGAVEIILGRSWLRDLGAVHDYGSDEIVVQVDGVPVRLQPAQEDRQVMAELEQPLQDAIDLQSNKILTFDSGEQALEVLPHPSEDLCMSVDKEEILVEACTGCTDGGHRVINPSRVGPRSTAAMPSSAAPPSSCASHNTLNVDDTDGSFTEHGNDIRKNLQHADAPTAVVPA